MWFSLLASLAVVYDLRLGLSEQAWRGILSNTQGRVADGYAVTQTLRTSTGDTLVRWSSTPALDPKGPNGLGVQWYGPDGTFRRWLPDAARIDGDFVLCGGRYLVGGGNTLRVWDARQQYKLVTKKVIPDLEQYHATKCAPNGVEIHDVNPYYGKNRTLRFSLPDLR